MVATISNFSVIAVSLTVWFAFDAETRSHFTTFQRCTLVLFGLLMCAVWWALMRTRVVATQAGLRVVNGYRTRTFVWAQVVTVRLPEGAPWAVLDVADGTSVQAIGLQASEGGATRRAVRHLRVLIDQQSATTRND